MSVANTYVPTATHTPADSVSKWAESVAQPHEDGFEGTSSWRNARPFVIRVTLLAAICSALLGYDIGITSGALLFVSQDFNLTTVQQEVFVGVLNLVSLVGALAAGRLADWIGRRAAMTMAAAVFFAGSLLMALSPNYQTLLAGRVVTGIGVGFGLTLPPMYISEIAPHRERGGLVSFGELFINLGILAGFLVAFLLAGLPTDTAWRWMLGIGILPAIALAAAVPLIPESPRWLIMHGQVRAAQRILVDTSADDVEAAERFREILEAAGMEEEVLGGEREEREGRVVRGSVASPARRVRSPRSPGFLKRDVDVGDCDNVEGSVVGSVHVVKPMEGAGGHSVWREILFPTAAVRRMLVVMLGTNFFQQATGIDAVVYYSPVVFRAVGVQSTRGLLAATLATGFTKVAFIVAASFLLDRFGRRPLLMASSSGMAAALAGLGCAFLLLPSSPSALSPTPSSPSSINAAAPAPDSTSAGAAALAIVSTSAFVAFFSVGMGPINWLLTAEIFPLQLRAQAIGMGTALNRLTSGAVAMSFLSLAEAMGRGGPFFLFSAMSVVACTFFYFFAPETKGKTLEQIVKMFEKKAYVRFGGEQGEVPTVGLAVFDGNSKMARGWGAGNESRQYSDYN